MVPDGEKTVRLRRLPGMVQSSAGFDLIVILILNAIALYFFAIFDVLEFMVSFAHSHERWELDEILPLGFTLAISFAWFSHRRVRELKALNRKHAYDARHDFLTGLHNRQYFDVVAEIEMERYMRSGFCFSLVMMDLDDFKEINDTRGHKEGDKILQELALRLRDLTRSVDDVVRWGGEEFVVLCRDTDAEGAFNVAQKILEDMRVNGFSTGDRITFSIGVASIDEVDSLDHLVNLADTRMYTAKRRGKDCIVSENTSGTYPVFGD